MEYVLIGVVLIVIMIVGIMALVVQYRLTKLNNYVKDAYTVLNFQYLRRWNIVEKMCLIIKDNEKIVNNNSELTELIELFGKENYSVMYKEQKMRVNMVISNHIDKLLVLSGKHTELKEHEEYSKLCEQLTYINEKIQSDRIAYNEHATAYNLSLEVFPNKYLARRFKNNYYERVV